MDLRLLAEIAYETAAMGHSPDTPSLSCLCEGLGGKAADNRWLAGPIIMTRTEHGLQKKTIG
ncbi:MAG: hypothetical protein WCL14_03855 [Bacteroidota bacterium]